MNVDVMLQVFIPESNPLLSDLVVIDHDTDLYVCESMTALLKYMLAPQLP